MSITRRTSAMPTTWRERTEMALSQWRQPQSPINPFENTHLWRHFEQREGFNKGGSFATVLEEALTRLRQMSPDAAELLTSRAQHRKKVTHLAKNNDYAESYIYKRQKEAIDHLTAILVQMENDAHAVHQRQLKERLDPPTCATLVNIEPQLEVLLPLIKGENPPWLICLEGLGGIGKTTLADALVRKLLMCDRFVDLAWVSARQQRLDVGGKVQEIEKPAISSEALIHAIATQLIGNEVQVASLPPQRVNGILNERLHQFPHLIVIDNLETIVDIESLLPILRRWINPTRILLTSRNHVDHGDIYHFQVPEMDQPSALRLIRHEAHVRNVPTLLSASDGELCPIYETVGGNPLALRLVVGQTHKHALAVVLDDLRQARGTSADLLYTYVYQRAWRFLEPLARRALLAMVMTTGRGATLERLMAISGLEPGDLHSALDNLVNRNLVDSRGDLHQRLYSIHALTRTFLQNQVAKWT